MNSFQYVAFEPREGVKKAINNYIENTMAIFQSPLASRIVVEKETTGFSFILTIAIGERSFTSKTFVSFETCSKQTRNWQVAVVDLLTRNIIRQYKDWKSSS